MGSPTRAAGGLVDDTLVGRDREMVALRGWLDAARDGAGRLVLCVGEPGIGKTRLAQELAGAALAVGTTVVWGRCVESDGAPAFWPWRQVLRTLGVDAESVLAGDAGSATDRFRVFDELTDALRTAAAKRGLVVVLDDFHWGDEPSLAALRHVADRLADLRLLVFAGLRAVEPNSVLPRVLPDLLRSGSVQRLDLQPLDEDDVGRLTGVADAGEIHDVTGGNPLFVREVARAISDGSWRPDHPPRSVLDVVGARLERVSSGCRGLLQAAALVGREFAVGVVSVALELPVRLCLSSIDEAIAHGLVDHFGAEGNYRFVHALTRDAVVASLDSRERLELHHAVALAIEQVHAGDLTDHLADLARHWGALAPYGEAPRARAAAIRAADDAVRRLAHEDAARLYRSALGMEPSSLAAEERCEVLIALGRAAKLAGDLPGAVEAAVEAGRVAPSPELLAEAALGLDAVPDPAVNALAGQLCDEALSKVDATALRARLLAQRSHLAFYDGDQPAVETLSGQALALARESGDDGALVEAIHARKEACPGPAGLPEREQLAVEMLDVARRSGAARSAMWARLWRIETLTERADFAAAVEELPVLRVAVERVGGPVSAWHLDKATACVAQAQGRYADAHAAARRGLERMRPVEPGPATGAYFALQSALAMHLGISEEAERFVRGTFDGPPRFRTVAKISRASLLVCAGLLDEAAASYQQAGPLAQWSLPAFFVLPAYVYATNAAIAIGRRDDLEQLAERFEKYRGAHAIGDGVAYLGPVELALGRCSAALGRWDVAVDALRVAADSTERTGAVRFAAEARFHLATALLARGDRREAAAFARSADELARALGMGALIGPTAALLTRLDGSTSPLSRRETEVAALVAEGLTNRQIAQRLIISERTAQTHVAHILAKLDLANRSQIATWAVQHG